MKLVTDLWLAALLLGSTTVSSASDACSDHFIAARASVTVSDGSAFDIRSQYHSAGGSTITHISEQESTIGVEGPISWTSGDAVDEIGSDFHKTFALGHQFHAFLLHFDKLVNDPLVVENVPFEGATHRGKRGGFPYGGVAFLVYGESGERALGLRFEFPETTPIEVSFGDWRLINNVELPFDLRIDDGERIFGYNFSSIQLDSMGLIDFYASNDSPSFDPLDIYRLHRKLLAAHCLGDADLMAALTAPDVTVASRGRLLHTNPADTLRRFSATFERFDYTGYADITFPEIEFSVDDGIGWIAVNVQATGQDTESQQEFVDQWAWIMLVKKMDGRWMHAGNASNRLE